MRTAREHKDKKVSAFKSGRESSEPKTAYGLGESSLHRRKATTDQWNEGDTADGQSAISHVSPHKQQTSLLVDSGHAR